MKDQARRSLDRLLEVRRHSPLPAPPRGWVRALRDALGMSARELGELLGVSQQAVANLEVGEVAGTVTMQRLESAARALGCRLEYVLVPEVPLQDMVDERARAKARQIVESVRHSMALEGHDVDIRDEVERLARDLVDKQGLWTDG